MKIAIITHPLKNNYGGLLQNYALQTVLKRMGHEVLTIDRIKRTPLFVKLLSITKRGIRRFLGQNVKLRAWPTEKEESIISINTRGFVNRNISTTTRVYNIKELKNIDNKFQFDAYVVGSDQVWRRDASGNSSEFLDFISNDNKVIKIAYAASFGVDNWTFTDKETNKYSKLIRKFDAISVREYSGVELCKKFLQVDADFMLDPTLLLDKEDYIELVKVAKKENSEGNLFVYLLDKTSNKQKIVSEISQELSLKPFEVMPEQNFMMDLPKGEKFNTNKCIYPNVETWIRGFMDAEFVVTDSFHGTVFAILFNKPFIAIQNSERGSTRFQSLLSLYNLQDRLVKDQNTFNIQVLNKKIDFKKTEEIRDQHKRNAFVFLNNALK